MEDSLDLLWPRPKSAVLLGESLALPPDLRFQAGTEIDGRALKSLSRVLEAVGLRSERGDEGLVSLHLDEELPSEAYRLRLDGQGVSIAGGGFAGLHHGISTFGQWLYLHRRGRAENGAGLEVPGLAVEDEPDFAVRGVMLDVSRDKVPTLGTLFGLVELLSRWKINQVQLYTEHTFAYRGHETVWREASPLTPEEVRSLDAFCRERAVELVPNQNSFGHFHRWLRHEAYRPLAEVPEGVKHPFGEEKEPFSLCPTDSRSLKLLGDLYDQLLPCFSSDQLNVGCDETFDLGMGRSAQACEEKGKEGVYLDFLREVHGLVRDRGKRMQFWGDIIVQHPERIRQLPEDAVALEWGYEAGHPFSEHGRRFARSGLDFYVCPGTSSWNSIGGRAHNALQNLAEAAVHGRKRGAMGYLVTDWGDFGHLQPLSVSFLGLLAGAGYAWNVETASSDPSPDFPALLDHHVFGAPGDGLGRAFLDLGNVYRAVGVEPKNASTLFHLFLFAGETLEHSRFEGLTPEGLEEAQDALAAVAADPSPDAPPAAHLAYEELLWATDFLDLCARLGRERLEAGRDVPLSALPATVRRHFSEEVDHLLETHTEIWNARNRPGGLRDSQSRLRRLQSLLSFRRERTEGETN